MSPIENYGPENDVHPVPVLLSVPQSLPLKVNAFIFSEMTFCLRLDHLKPSVAPQAVFGESSPKIMKWECVYLWIHKAVTDGIRDTVADRTKPPSSAKFRVIPPFYVLFPLFDLDQIYCTSVHVFNSTQLLHLRFFIFWEVPAAVSQFAQ